MATLDTLRRSTAAAICLECGKCSTLCPLVRFEPAPFGPFSASRLAAIREPADAMNGGRTAVERCLTCELPEFRKQHAGNADWHPSGQFLVFQAEAPFTYDGEPLPFLAIPGRNRSNAIWVISVQGRNIWQLTGQREAPFPAHSPRFSFEGGQLAWSERVAAAGTWGDWVVRVGEFSSGRGVARVRDLASGEQRDEPIAADDAD